MPTSTSAGSSREVVRDIGYTSARLGFDAATCGVVVALDEQSPDIRRGVDSSYEEQHGESESEPTPRAPVTRG